MNAVLQVEGLHKAFGGVQAVADVSFAVSAGELLAMIGPNGAGKSTCFNMLNGQLAPDLGIVRLEGRDIVGLRPRAIWRLGVGRTFQITATFASLSVRENVQMALYSHAGKLRSLLQRFGAALKAEADALLAQVGMLDQAERTCGVLAYGDLKRVELAMALANEPRLLLMDEPTAGMAPKETRGADGTDGEARARAQHRRPVHRARHGRGVQPGRPHHRARPRPGDRRRHARGSARQCRRACRLSREHALMLPPMLQVKDLHAYYGRAHILHGVSLEAREGEVVALLGRNGAGKSTAMKAIMGLVPPSQGEVAFDGQRIERLPSYRIARLGLGYVPEERRIFTELTVMENLEVGRQAPRAGAPGWSEDKLFALFPNLASMRDRPGGRMSGGEQQMLTIARTLMGNPRCVLLDEPSEGLAPIIVEQMANSIRALKGEGLSVLLSEQNLHFSLGVADRAYIIEKGQIRFGGSMAELAADASLREQYLSV